MGLGRFWTGRCLVRLQEYLGHGDLGAFGFVEGWLLIVWIFHSIKLLDSR